MEVTVDYTLPPPVFEIVDGLALDPSLVVDVGSGGSTVRLARMFPAAWVVALEHDPPYAAGTQRLLDVDPGVAGRVDVRLAPLRPHHRPGLLAGVWYAPEGWDKLAAIDLLVVDGPPGAGGPHARHPALPLLHDRLTPGAVVLLDDTDRPDENTIVGEWEARYGLVFTRCPHSGRELAWARIP